MTFKSFAEVHVFVGRNEEMKTLKDIVLRKKANFIVVKGRRRIGKSTLIKEFCKKNKIILFEFQGLAPGKKVKKSHQLQEFSKTLANYMNVDQMRFLDWKKALDSLKNLNFKRKTIILLDEISWMAQGDPAFASTLKSTWDSLLSEIDNLTLVVSGSVSSWIDENISQNTGYVGRVSAELFLKELTLNEAYSLIKAQNSEITTTEFWQILSLIGGVPKYIEEVNANEPPELNIKKYFLKPGSFFLTEFEKIFSDIFNKKSTLYKKILIEISKNKISPVDLADKLNLPINKNFSKAITDLELAGFICRDYTWTLKNQNTLKLSKLRVSDNYTRFYLKYVLRHKNRLEKLPMKSKDTIGLVNWDSILGYQFENLVLNNLPLIVELLDIPTNEITQIGPFFQPSTRGKKGVQIDLLIQTKYNNIYICEFKSQAKIGYGIVEEVSQKIKSLQKARGTSIRTALIYIGELSQSVIERDYFYKTIDLNEVLLN